jgi:2-dehydro-3-deoxyphosphogluconate aldolase/(4S)-4-hydroxy-2-oxoglutarate aldolase
MTDSSVLEEICRAGVVPVVVLDDERSARPLGDALKAGGLRVAEVTFRTAQALAALRSLALDPELIVGAGTVLSPDQVDLALEAGAKFAVMPGFSRAVLERCREVGLPVVPGVATPTDVIAVLDQGIELMKFFPAEASGGLAMLQALHGPFPGVRFIPTGGVGAANAAEYLALPYVAALGGSWMVAAKLVRDGDFASVTRLAAEAVQIVTGARG